MLEQLWGIIHFRQNPMEILHCLLETIRLFRLVIGNGEGANWWCVLFPPLCFVDVTHGTVPDSVKEDLKDALTEEEYDILTSADEESDIPIKVKFKIVELFQDSKVKFTGAFNKLFNIPG